MSAKLSATPKRQNIPAVKVTSLAVLLKEARVKIQEDLLRFRTCCADPRASK